MPTYIPSYPMLRGGCCPSGPPLHPINRFHREKCPLSQLMFDIGAGEGFAGATRGWTKVEFTTKKLELYGFTVIVEQGEVPIARCNNCDTEMSLRRISE